MYNSNMFLTSNNYTIPNVPIEFVGKEPTMVELYQFAQQHPAKFKDVQDYFYDTNQKVWLYGQILIECNKLLTENLIQSAIDENCRRLKEYGGPCNSWEAASMQTHEHKFKIFLKTMEIYYNTRIEEYYRPSGEGYLDALNNWNNRN